MAKTLIGNVKGKDGRGISKIEKTATTGSVDTYTIAYTDGTESTYEVKNSDSVAIQRQIVPSAAVESSTTASQAYTAGDYVVVGGVLRKVKSSIAKGSAIGDSNSTATTVTREIKDVQDSVSQDKKDIAANTKKITQSPGGWRYLYGSATSVDNVCYRKTNNIVEVLIDCAKNVDSDWKVGTLPVGYRPSTDINVSAVATVGWTLSDHTAYILVKSDGVVWCRRKVAESNGRILGYMNYLV
nr:MAG TPA: receptor binding protein [Caudoviricetes sp.]